jgi:hypothetical protein
MFRAVHRLKSMWRSMMDYRVHVPRMAYGGGDKRKLEKQRRDAVLCAEIEANLQRRYDEIEPGEIRAILAHQVAWEIGADVEQVRLIMCRIQGGSNGVTFSKTPLPGQPWAHERPATEIAQNDTLPSQDITPDGRLILNGRARHAKFGDGFIAHIRGNQVTIEFDEGGSKRVIASFLEPLSI